MSNPVERVGQQCRDTSKEAKHLKQMVQRVKVARMGSRAMLRHRHHNKSSDDTKCKDGMAVLLRDFDLEDRTEELEPTSVVMGSGCTVVVTTSGVDDCHVERGQGEDTMQEVEVVKG